MNRNALDKSTITDKLFKSSRLFLLVMIGLLLVGSFACDGGGRQGGNAGGDTVVGPANQFPSRKEYELVGRVVAVDKAERRVMIAHEAIPGYMDAMTMGFALADEFYYDQIQPGDEIRAALVVDRGRTVIEHPVITRSTPTGTTATPSQTADLSEPQIGTVVPAFEFVNQDGEAFKLDRYRGQTLLITFIYTRCPLPDYCPLMSSNLAEIAGELVAQKDAQAPYRFLSVSFDPTHDTPQVLREYRQRFAGDKNLLKYWEYATGTPEQIRRAANYFGLIYSGADDGTINHSLRTLLIAPNGKLLKVYRGNEWRPADVAADMRSAGTNSVGSESASSRDVHGE